MDRTGSDNRTSEERTKEPGVRGRRFLRQKEGNLQIKAVQSNYREIKY